MTSTTPTVSSEAPQGERHRLSGWGESVHGWARVHRPGTTAAVQDLVRGLAAAGRRITLRGAGRSYGDAALATGSDVLDLRGLDGIRAFDRDAGVIEVEAGVTIENLWRHVIAAGYWPMVVPGTMRPTVGGCIAMNVHGKNQFRDGPFGDHVLELEWVRPDGEVQTVSRAHDEELFLALLGGFGMLGVVTAAKLRLKRVHAGGVAVTAVPTSSLEEMIALFDEFGVSSDYLVGWVDCFHGSNRGVVHAGRHFRAGETWHGTPALEAQAQELPPTVFGVLPRALLSPFIQPFGTPTGMRLINFTKYWVARLYGRTSFVQSHAQFAFLLDYVPRWKRIYDPGGLVQHQSFVPRASSAAVHGELLRMCRASGLTSWLGVFKRHQSDAYLMSHLVDGYSLAMDFAVTPENRERLFELCHAMDRVVLDAGGKFYLAKDSTAEPASLRRAYPGLDRFLALKQQVDPQGLFHSDMAERLLTPLQAASSEA